MPIIEKLIDEGKVESEASYYRIIKNKFNEYITRKYESFFTIDTLVLQNRQIPFDNLYYPLTVASQEENKLIEFKIDRYHKGFIPTYKKVLIVDTAGSGKSTILRKLFLSVIKQKYALPIFIELRKLNEKNLILDEIYEQLNPIDKEINREVIFRLLEKGGFVFFFDGFDEIEIEKKEIVINDIHSFLEKSSNNEFIISSRLEDSLASFSDFKRFNIRPLAINESYQLIRLYASNNKNGKNAESLISLLNDGQKDELKEFLINPFLVSLLYTVFDYGRNIPVETTQFYRLIYDALFDRHDLTKEGYFKRQKRCNLHRDDFEKIMRGIAYICFAEYDSRLSKDNFLSIINRSKSFFQLSFKPSDYFEDLLMTVPFITRDGNYYKWRHNSIRDYFAAKFIVLNTGNKAKDILLRLFQADEASLYNNIFEHVFYLDFKLFKHTLFKFFLADLVKEYHHYRPDESDTKASAAKQLFELQYLIRLRFGSDSFMFLGDSSFFRLSTHDFNSLLKLKNEFKIYRRMIFRDTCIWGIFFSKESSRIETFHKFDSLVGDSYNITSNNNIIISHINWGKNNITNSNIQKLSFYKFPSWLKSSNYKEYLSVFIEVADKKINLDVCIELLEDIIISENESKSKERLI